MPRKVQSLAKVRNRTVSKGTIGSSFDDFLREEGIYETVQVAAIKRLLAWQLEQAMAAQDISKSEMDRAGQLGPTAAARGSLRPAGKSTDPNGLGCSNERNHLLRKK